MRTKFIVLIIVTVVGLLLFIGFIIGVSFGNSTMPKCGDDKDQVGKLLGKPSFVQGPGIGVLFGIKAFDIEWVYLNNHYDIGGWFRDTHWIYAIQFVKNNVIKISRSEETYDDLKRIVVCDNTVK